MTNGELLFYGGAALLGLTVILLIIFLIKKPKYKPEGGDGQPRGTGQLRNSYPTEPVGGRRAEPKQTEKLTTGTAVLENGTVLLRNEQRTTVLEPGTIVLGQSSASNSGETAIFDVATELLEENN